MNILLFSIFITLANVSMAHDEGHGPKLGDAPKHGGTIASVVKLKDANKGANAELQYKSEFVRSDDGKIGLYIYDKALGPIDLKSFDKKARGVVEVMKKGKVAKKLPFDVSLVDNVFTGTVPKSPTKPFNIYVILKSSGQEYLTELSNVD